jgi:hypothetical protein
MMSRCPRRTRCVRCVDVAFWRQLRESCTPTSARSKQRGDASEGKKRKGEKEKKLLALVGHGECNAPNPPLAALRHRAKVAQSVIHCLLSPSKRESWDEKRNHLPLEPAFRMRSLFSFFCLLTSFFFSLALNLENSRPLVFLFLFSSFKKKKNSTSSSPTTRTSSRARSRACSSRMSAPGRRSAPRWRRARRASPKSRRPQRPLRRP